MATDAERYAALREYAVRWGFMPAEFSQILRDVRATDAEFDAMADAAVQYVREHVPNSGGIYRHATANEGWSDAG